MDSQEYRTVARCIDRVTIQLTDRGWKEAVAEYSAIEPELLALFQADADKQEVKRRIREAIVTNISIADPAPDDASFQVAWDKMLQVGFSSDERKLSMQFFRLRYLIDHTTDPARIDAELFFFREGVLDMLGGPDAEMGKHFSAVYDRLCARRAQRAGSKS